MKEGWAPLSTYQTAFTPEIFENLIETEASKTSKAKPTLATITTSKMASASTTFKTTKASPTSKTTTASPTLTNVQTSTKTTTPTTSVRNSIVQNKTFPKLVTVVVEAYDNNDSFGDDDSSVVASTSDVTFSNQAATTFSAFRDTKNNFAQSNPDTDTKTLLTTKTVTTTTTSPTTGTITKTTTTSLPKIHIVGDTNPLKTEPGTNTLKSILPHQ